MENEQAVLQWLRTITQVGPNYAEARQALALLDAKDAEIYSAKRELVSLMDSIWRAEFRKQSPEWKPLDDLPGMISQMDNMYAGVRNQRDEALAKVAELEKRLEIPDAPFQAYDGIVCRDETIKLQDERIERLTATVAEMQAAMVGAVKVADLETWCAPLQRFAEPLRPHLPKPGVDPLVEALKPIVPLIAPRADETHAECVARHLREVLGDDFGRSRP